MADGADGMKEKLRAGCSHGLLDFLGSQPIARRRALRQIGPMKSVAVLGASTNPEKYGHRAVVAFAAKGFTVYPINPRADQVAGHPCLSDLTDLPARPDVVSAYLPPQLLLGTLSAVAECGCEELWLNPGTDTPEVLSRAAELGLNTVQGCSLVALASGRLKVANE